MSKCYFHIYENRRKKNYLLESFIIGVMPVALKFAGISNGCGTFFASPSESIKIDSLYSVPWKFDIPMPPPRWFDPKETMGLDDLMDKVFQETMEKETKSEWEKETGEKETKAEWLERRNAFKRSNPYIKHACVNRDPSCSNDGVWDQADMNHQPLDQNFGEPSDIKEMTMRIEPDGYDALEGTDVVYHQKKCTSHSDSRLRFAIVCPKTNKDLIEFETGASEAPENSNAPERIPRLIGLPGAEIKKVPTMSRNAGITMFTYNKTSTELREALGASKELEPCRRALWKQGCHTGGCHGPWYFIRPDQWDHVMTSTMLMKLGSHHVIIADEFGDVVDRVVNKIRSKARPKKKDLVFEL